MRPVPGSPTPSPVPTLVPGRDRLPDRCPVCGSRRLYADPPFGTERVGTVVCGDCGRVLAYLGPSLSTAPPRGVAAFVRVTGCTEHCTPSLGHAPAAHEQHGRALALSELKGAGGGIIRTGRLAVDLDRRAAYVDGQDVGVSAQRFVVLAILARALDCCVSWYDIVERAWDRPTADAWAGARHGGFHALRVLLARLRHQLGPARPLVETVPHYGLRLRQERYVGPLALPPPAPRELPGSPLPAGAWARHWARCQVCGTTDRPHKSRGRCHRCADRDNRVLRRSRKEML